jgi:hypothetical protein
MEVAASGGSLAEALRQLGIGAVDPHHVLRGEFDKILPETGTPHPVGMVRRAKLTIGAFDFLHSGTLAQAQHRIGTVAAVSGLSGGEPHLPDCGFCKRQMLALAFDGQERPVIIKHVADAALHRQEHFCEQRRSIGERDLDRDGVPLNHA